MRVAATVSCGNEANFFFFFFFSVILYAEKSAQDTQIALC